MLLAWAIVPDADSVRVTPPASLCKPQNHESAERTTTCVLQVAVVHRMEWQGGGKDIARDTGAQECASCACIRKERYRIRSDTARVSVDHKQSSPHWQRASTTARSRRPMIHLLEMFENKWAWECAHPSADFDFELDQMKEARLPTHGGLRLPTFHGE
uniref:Uncharacterized protein n=1 Tax=Noctiluca scintillans TaxID=2966 RepID=A0A7S0ZYM9_NOCSC|mmetsp:Transcript_2372/g.6849  ORF Transcript_2372/g.6849 Transcript_2372/m.6849 type:complete len:158 (+) Transcript_2372:295-768(+)